MLISNSEQPKDSKKASLFSETWQIQRWLNLRIFFIQIKSSNKGAKSLEHFPALLQSAQESGLATWFEDLSHL